MTTFNTYMKENEETLEMYTTAITRAHGKNHPEAFDVRELYTEIHAKTTEAGAERPVLDVEFAELREVTNHYEIPGDVCQTFAAVYDMLSEADQILPSLKEVVKLDRDQVSMYQLALNYK